MTATADPAVAPAEDLRALAALAGVETSYHDVRGHRHVAGDRPLRAVLRALGHDVADTGPVAAAVEAARRAHTAAVVPACVVCWDGDDLHLPVRFPAGAAAGRLDLAVHLEDGGEVVLGGHPVDPGDGRADEAGAGVVVDVVVPLPPLPHGYHDLWLSHPAVGSLHRTLVLAPRNVVGLGGAERLWGCFAPVHALRTDDPLGPSVTDLDRLGAWLDRFGGKVVGTLPLLAGFLDEPYDPSPYSPVSRRFWNEVYADLARLPELLDRPVLAGWLASDDVRAAFAELAAAPTYDHRAQHALRRRALAAALVGHDDTDLAGLDGVDPEVSAYAAFRATVERTGRGWHDWPERQRGGRLDEGDYDPLDARFHELAQHVLRRQLAGVAAGLAGRGQRLYLDLPVGTHAAGYDTWRHPELYAWGMSAGAPPDDFFTGGQDWGFPPVVPSAGSAEAHRQLRAVLHHHMAVAGVLRLDHVMGLQRLFWVPEGYPATDGIYVRYPVDELFAVLAIEAHRHDCVVVGEDLGTVPDEVRDAMARHQLLGMYVAEFAVPADPGAPLALPTDRQLASVDTHDTATFAAWLTGGDIELRRRLGLSGEADDAAEHADRAVQVANLVQALRAAGTLPPDRDAVADGREGSAAERSRVLLEALLRHLGDGDSPIVLAALEDLWGEVEPQNVPGTPADRPNWVHRFPRPLGALADDPDVAGVLHALQDCRLGSHLRAKEVHP